MTNHVFGTQLLLLSAFSLCLASLTPAYCQTPVSQSDSSAQSASPNPAESTEAPANVVSPVSGSSESALQTDNSFTPLLKGIPQSVTVPAPTPVPYNFELSGPRPEKHFYALYPLAITPVVGKSNAGEIEKNETAQVRGDVDFGPYMADLQRRLKRAWLPPVGQETTRLKTIFKVHRGGELSDLHLKQPSGLAAADNAGLAAIVNAAPFRPLPAGSPAVVDIEFTFDYNVFKESGSHGFQNSVPIYDREAELKSAVARLEAKGFLTNLPSALLNLAHYYVDVGQTDEAIATYGKARLLLLNKVRKPGQLAYVDSGLAVIYQQRGKYSEAASLFSDALNLRLKLVGTTATTLALGRCDLASAFLYADDGHLLDALRLFDDALVDIETGKADLSTSNVVGQISNELEPMIQKYWNKKDWKNALPLCNWVLKHNKNIEDSSCLDLLLKMKDVADCHFELGQFEAALPLYELVLSNAAEMRVNYLYYPADEVSEAQTRLDAVDKKLGLLTRSELAHQQEIQKRVDRAFSWTPFAFASTLFLLLGTSLSGVVMQRQSMNFPAPCERLS